MKRLIPFLLIVITIFSCQEESEELMICGTGTGQCTTPATVRDITGLDACFGFVFELEDGTSLLPVVTFYCGTEPFPDYVQDDPLHNFEFVNGKKILIDYELVESDLVDACMVGQRAKITCLREISEISEDTR